MLQNDYFEAMPCAEPEEVSSLYDCDNDPYLHGIDVDYQYSNAQPLSPQLSDDELAAIADMEADYQEQRARDQAIIKEQLDKLHREELRQKFEHYLLTANDYLPPMVPVVQRHDSLICSEGNISAIVGEAKSKKTFLCTAIVGSMLDVRKRKHFGIQSNRCQVLWVDTEQSQEHIQKVLFRINVLGGLPYNTPDPLLQLLTVREEAPVQRLNAMCYAIEYFQPKLVVVDGVSDLLTNTNNLEESEALVSKLLALSSMYKCHIMCVLHTNPNSDKARGHLGSTLMRKAESVVYVHKVGEMSYVEPQYCRNMPFERFAFKVEEFDNEVLIGPACEGLGVPVECEVEEYESVKKEDDCVRILRDNFGGACERSLLCNKLVEVLGVTHGNARVKVSRAISRGLLVDCDKYISLAAVL